MEEIIKLVGRDFANKINEELDKFIVNDIAGQRIKCLIILYEYLSKEKENKEQFDYQFLAIAINETFILNKLFEYRNNDYISFVEQLKDGLEYEETLYFLCKLISEFKNKKNIHIDERGIHMKYYHNQYESFGEVKEVFSTINQLGTLRGLHFQTDPVQQKIIKCLNGFFNVKIIVPKLNNWYENIKTLNYEDQGARIKEYKDFIEYDFLYINQYSKEIFVPEYCLLGYISLQNNSIMTYVADECFSAQGDNGVNPFQLGTHKIEWNMFTLSAPILSERDKLGSHKYPKSWKFK